MLKLRLLITSSIILQTLDGILTFVGVKKFGIDAEGNIFLHFLMNNWGPEISLLITKIFGIILLLSLGSKYFENHRSFVCDGLWIVNFFYFFIAVLPWSYVLLTHT